MLARHPERPGRAQAGQYVPAVPDTKAQSAGVWQACVCPLARHRTERCGGWVYENGRWEVCFSSSSPTQKLNTLLLRMGPHGTAPELWKPRGRVQVKQ